jgi:adenylylsulfate kinase
MMDPGIVVWLTGLPASGKTTLAERVRQRLAEQGRPAILLDSDALRPLLAPARGYGVEDRAAFYQRLGELAGRLARRDRIVLVAATAPLRAHRASARALAPRFAEIYVDVPLAECARRDPKGLYARARAGGAPELPGVGSSFEPPEDPAVVARGGLDPSAVDAILDLVEREWRPVEGRMHH